MNTMQTHRRRLACAAALLLAGCGTSPPLRLYRLPLDGPGAAPMAGAGSAQTWELAATRLPEYLDRDMLVLAHGDTSMQMLEGDRWAEPLRDSVPRVLQHDLALLRGAGRVWGSPAPAGVTVDRILRIELLELHADALRGRMRLQARWWFSDPRAPAVAPTQDDALVELPLAGSGGADIAQAHRAALWQLARRIAASP